MPVECLDLKALFGERYRVLRDKSSYQAEYGENAYRPDPWLWIIPCRQGEIFPHGGNLLAASTKRRGLKSGELKRLACCRVHQDGDDGVTVVFNLADFETVAAIMEPKRRLRWSAAQRAAHSGRLFKSPTGMAAAAV